MGGDTIKVVHTIRDMQSHSRRLRQDGQRIGFVPTMGYLHEGHLALMRLAQAHADAVVVSIFVNPTQFGPNEDFAAYPRDLDRDCRLAEKEGVAVVFTPEAEAFYPPNYQTYINLEALPRHLCGVSRPGHFSGVATVVAKLFHCVTPHAAVFGQKDYQQLAVIRQMVADLNMDIEIIGAPTVREPDGLAMSSRNAYLQPEQRPAALSLHRSLIQAKQAVAAGTRNVSTLITAARVEILAHPQTEVDYIEICNPVTLDSLETVTGPALMALAVKVGQTRLIDNMLLTD